MARSTLANLKRRPTGFPCPLPRNKVLPIDVSYSLALEMNKPKKEMEQYLCLQTKRLRVALQHLVSLMSRLESKAPSLLRQKEGRARANKKATELEEYLKRAEAEGQTWQRIARENEKERGGGAGKYSYESLDSYQKTQPSTLPQSNFPFPHTHHKLTRYPKSYLLQSIPEC